MQVVSELNELTSALRKSRAQNDRIGFVPTMGALHSGHASLIHHAKSQSQFVVLSIFVNPTQFNDSADFENYPSTVQADLEMARLHHVDLVFMPKAEDDLPFPFPVCTIIKPFSEDFVSIIFSRADLIFCIFFL